MVFASFGLVLAAGYYLWTIQRMFYGKLHLKAGIDKESLVDMNNREWLMFIPLILLTALLGIFPHFVLDLINASVETATDFVFNTGLEYLKIIQK